MNFHYLTHHIHIDRLRCASIKHDRTGIVLLKPKPYLITQVIISIAIRT